MACSSSRSRRSNNPSVAQSRSTEADRDRRLRRIRVPLPGVDRNYSMPVHNADIARVFEDIADLLEIQEANPFRVRAYRNAARTVGDLRLDVAATLEAGKALPKLPRVGEDLARKIPEPVGGGGWGG